MALTTKLLTSIKTPGEAFTYDYFQDEDNDCNKSDKGGNSSTDTDIDAESGTSELEIVGATIVDNRKLAGNNVNKRKSTSDNIDESNILSSRRESIPTNRFVSPTSQAIKRKRNKKAAKGNSGSSSTNKRPKRGKNVRKSSNSDNGDDNVDNDDNRNIDADDDDATPDSAVSNDNVVDGKSTNDSNSAGSGSGEVVNNSPNIIGSDKTDSNDKAVNDNSMTSGDSADRDSSSAIVGDSTVDNDYGSSIVNNSASDSGNNVVSGNTSSSISGDPYRQGLRDLVLATFYRRLDQVLSKLFLAYAEMNNLGSICVALDDSSSTANNIQSLVKDYLRRTNDIMTSLNLDGRLNDINAFKQEINRKMFPRSPSMLY